MERHLYSHSYCRQDPCSTCSVYIVLAFENTGNVPCLYHHLLWWFKFPVLFTLSVTITISVTKPLAPSVPWGHLTWKRSWPSWSSSRESRLTDSARLDVCICVQPLISLCTLCNSKDCAHQAPLSTGFSWQEYWSGLPFPPPGDPPSPGVVPHLLRLLQEDSSLLSHQEWLLMIQNGYQSYLLLLFSCWVMSDSLWPPKSQLSRFPCLSLSPGVCSDSCPLSQWCHLTILFSVIPFSSCPQSFPASGSFPISQLFASGGQSIGTSASAPALPMNIQGWFPLGLAGLILLSRRLSRVFSSSGVWKHQFSGTQPSLWPIPHIHAWLLGKP